jgi:hypothetical protein
MFTRAFLIMLLLLLVVCGHAQPTPPVLQEPWQTGYTGTDLTGPKVLGCWLFAPGAELKDSSSKGNDLQLQGGIIRPQGKFGGALESDRGFPIIDKPHAAVAKASPSLSPRGAFTLEMWLQLKPEIADYPMSYIIDKKYVAPTDYQITLNRDASGMGRFSAILGFGADSDTWNSDMLKLDIGTWYHLVFTYDGAGNGRFLFNGSAAGGALKPARGAIAPGKANLSIGDRLGSNYRGFPGLLSQVRLCDGVLEFSPASFALTSDRTAFRRLETTSLKFALTNLQRSKLSGAKATISVGGVGARDIVLPDLDPGAVYEINYPLNTTLKPGAYDVTARVTIPGEKPFVSLQQFPINIVGRPLPRRMPVVMWGADPSEWQRLREIGFTHCSGLWADFDKIWKAGKPTEAAAPDYVARSKHDLDNCLVNGLEVFSGFAPGYWLQAKPEFWRVGRDGKPYGGKEHSLCALFPECVKFSELAGASLALTYKDFPAFTAANINTEIRDGAQLCFHEHDKAAFRQFAGYDIPAGAVGRSGVPYQGIQGFPSDRVIPDDFPLYVYYKWFWQQGDGWNGLQTATNRGLKSTGRTDFWTFHDPAVRVASVFGSGGEVDYLSQWTYSYPDPIRIGLATDELFAMAAGAGRPQGVMKMTQVIWYRSQTAPEAGETATLQSGTTSDKDTGPRAPGQVAAGVYQADWERAQPDARFITIAPMQLREAFWTKMARPIQGIMYHGWESLVETGRKGGYRYTNPATRDELQRLVHTVIEPLGPALMQIPDRRPDVAFLESFASQMFARRGTYGWSGGWAADAYFVLDYAQLQPQVVYEETIQKQGLEGYKVLVMMDCDVLPRSVLARVEAFQRKGGLIIGDENLCPAIKPDILLRSLQRPKEDDQARALLQQKAADLRRELDAHYQRYAWSSNSDIVTRVRQFGSTDYFFAVNDRREYGTYVGHHKLVMENGLPSEASLSLRRATGYVYDLVSGRPVTSSVKAGVLTIPAQFGPCEGRLLMVTSRPISGVRCTAPEKAVAGEVVNCAISVVDDAGKPLDAMVPVKVDILDPSGEAAEFSGYYGAANGQLALKLTLAPNDLPGMWQVRVQELASGQTGSAFMRVTTK